MHRWTSFAGSTGPLRRLVAWSAILWLLAGPATVELAAAEFWVDADGGANGNSGTSPAAPWKTLSRAIADPRLAPGDVIHVDAGIYDTALGETFPLALVDGVAIVGDDGAAATTLVAPVAVPVFLNQDTPLGPGTALRGFTLRHAGPGSDADLVRFELGSVAMEPWIHDNVLGGHFELDEPAKSFDRSRWRRATRGDKGLDDLGGEIGIHVVDSAAGTRSFGGLIDGNTFTDLLAAVAISGSRRGTARHAPVVTDNAVAGGLLGMGFFASGRFAGELSPTVSGNTIADAAFVGLSFFLSQGGSGEVVATPTLAGNTVTGSPVGIWLSASTAHSAGSTTLEATIDGNRLDDVVAGIVLAAATGGAGGVDLEWNVAVRNNVIMAGGADTLPIPVAGVQLQALGEGASRATASTTISGNTVDLAAAPAAASAVGLLVAPRSLGGAGAASYETVVSGNTVSGAVAGIWAQVSSLAGTGGDRVTTEVAGNRVSAGAAGIAASTFDDGAAVVSTLVAGNTVTGATTGIWVSSSSVESVAGPVDVVVRDNLVRDNLDHGMAFALDPAAARPPLVTCNTVTANGTDGLDAGVLVTDLGGGTPDLGGGVAGSAGRNAVFANGSVELRNRSPRGVAAENAWWGTAAAATIDARIADDEEAPGRGAVDFQPFLAAAPASIATADLQVTAGLYPVDGRPRPSARFTARAALAGACGCANPRLRADVPAGATVVAATLSRGVLTDAVGVDGQLDAALGTLLPGEEVTLDYEVLPAPGSCLVASRARLTCDNLGAAVTSAVTRQAAAAPDLRVLKVADAEEATAGDPLVYTVTVENLDPSCAASGARLRDALPKAFHDARFVCAAGPGSDCDRRAGKGDLDERIDVGPGETVTFTISGTIFAGFVGELHNEARVTHASDLERGNDEAAAATVVVAPLGDLFPTEIPTLGEHLLLLFALLLVAAAGRRLRRAGGGDA